MGLYLKKELKGGGELAVWEITESEKELLDILASDGEERDDELEEISLYKSEQSRRERLAVLALVQMLFEEPVHIGHHENGSPYIENSSTRISITHSRRFAGVIIHPSEEVGIDIESIKRDFSAVEKRALSHDEREDLIQRNDEDANKMEERNTQLALYWSAKEALFKRMGRNNVDFSEDMEVGRFTLRNEGEIDITWQLGGQEEFEMQYEVFEDHVLVWMVG